MFHLKFKLLPNQQIYSEITSNLIQNTNRSSGQKTNFPTTQAVVRRSATGIGFAMFIRSFICSTRNQFLEYIENCLTENHQFYRNIHTDIVYRVTGNMTSLSTSVQKLKGKSMRKYCFRRLRVEFLKNGSN